ncbi:hypothetical protein D3C85_1634900 [compost metagenome]
MLWRPAFHASATRMLYWSMVSGSVVGTISTKIWLPRCCSYSASTFSSAARCWGASVPVRSVTRWVSGGTATNPSAARAGWAANIAARHSQMPKKRSRGARMMAMRRVRT